MIRFSIFILIVFVFSCHRDNSSIVEIIEIHEEDIINKKITLTKNLTYNTAGKDFYFTSLAMLDNEELLAFDKNEGLIIKFDRLGNIIKATGGIGEGPNEYVVDIYADVLYCGQDQVIAFDWSLSRMHLYDKKLTYKRSIQLDGVPYEMTCYEDDSITLLYSTKQDAEVMNTNGNIFKTFKFDDESINDLTNFKHVEYKDDIWFMAYYFQPIFLRFDEKKGLTHKIKLPARDPELVKTATRSLSVTKDAIHLFYHDLNSPMPRNRRKIAHVFSDSATYKFSYQIPIHINYYEIISEDKLVALEDSMRKIALYNFIIHE